MTATRAPRHVAVIMDGNGRWAQRRGKPRVYGHIRGASRIKAIVQEADRLGVRALTLFAFSTENWSRPGPELRVLWSILKKYLRRETENLRRQNVRLRVLGEVERLSDDVQRVLKPSLARLAGNTGLQLNFAVSYGSRREIIDAARRIALDYASGRLALDTLDEGAFQKYLWTAPLGELADVDLVIRTSGEKRVSNFLLWQSAYAEYHFTDVLWPDFSPEDFRLALQEFGRRERRFGGVRPLDTSQGLVT